MPYYKHEVVLPPEFTLACEAIAELAGAISELIREVAKVLAAAAPKDEPAS